MPGNSILKIYRLIHFPALYFGNQAKSLASPDSLTVKKNSNPFSLAFFQQRFTNLALVKIIDSIFFDN